MSADSIDLTSLNELKGIMGDDFSELITVFINDGQTQLNNLASAVEASDAPTIKRIAHTLKGSSANLGIEQLSAICKELELKAADNVLDSASDLLSTISNEFKDVKIILEKLI